MSNQSSNDYKPEARPTAGTPDHVLRKEHRPRGIRHITLKVKSCKFKRLNGN